MNKRKGKQQPFNAKATTTFKKKKKDTSEMSCFTCSELSRFATDCLKHADRKDKKVNLVTATNTNDGYGSLPTVLLVFQSPSWWLDTGANIHVCANISLFSSYQLLQGSSILMGERIICFCLWCWYGRSEVYFRQDHAAEKRATCPHYSQKSC
jgi:hypothetical protein